MTQIEMFTMDNCLYCHELKRLLESSGIDYVEHNTSTDKNAKYELLKAKQMFIPVLRVDGEFVTFDGFIQKFLNGKIKRKKST